MPDTAVISTAYLGPVSYYASIFSVLYGKDFDTTKEKQSLVIMDVHEHYRKQTYRNRCRIASASGAADLSIPVIKKGDKCATKDIEISYTENWQLIHWRTIEAAYNSSPFFEYLKDDYLPLYQTKTKHLIDFNAKLHEVISDHLGLALPFTLSSDYVEETSGMTDYRDAFSPKRECDLPFVKYYQVFEEKNSFLPDLSIIDLLFNMGNESILTLISQAGKVRTEQR